MAPAPWRAHRPPAGHLAVALLAAAGCARTVNGDAHSGKDVRYKGAKHIKIDEYGEGRSAKDIVTYPGGDRVDWKVFEVGTPPEDDKNSDHDRDKDKDKPAPAEVVGTLKIKVQWRPPRDGLDLAFDVYDQYFHRIARARPSPDAGKRSKKVTIKDAGPGRYYVQVYAPRRMDAAGYRVMVKFQAQEVTPAGPSAPSEIPDPPVLAALPDQPDPNAAPASQPTGPTPPPTPAVQPVSARVVRYTIAGGGVTITVDKGKNNGVDAGWKGELLNNSGHPVQGGTFVVSKVTSGEATGKVSLSADQIQANKRVRLLPPGP